MIRWLVLAVLANPLLPIPTHAEECESEAVTLPFEQCLAMIQKVAEDLGAAPIKIVETSVLRMVRFPIVDGSALVTYGKPDKKMVLTKTNHGQ